MHVFDVHQVPSQIGDKTIEGVQIGRTAGMVSGGVIGGGLLGLTGGVLGGTVGYVGDLAVQNAPEYEFKIKQFSDSQILTIRQQSGVISVNTSVRILEKNGELFIKKIK